MVLYHQIFNKFFLSWVAQFRQFRHKYLINRVALRPFKKSLAQLAITKKIQNQIFWFWMRCHGAIYYKAMKARGSPSSGKLLCL